MPSTPGITMSSRTTSGGLAASAWTASGAEPTAVTS